MDRKEFNQLPSGVRGQTYLILQEIKRLRYQLLAYCHYLDYQNAPRRMRDRSWETLFELRKYIGEIDPNIPDEEE